MIFIAIAVKLKWGPLSECNSLNIKAFLFPTSPKEDL